MKRLALYLIPGLMSIGLFSCRQTSDELLSYGQNDVQVYTPAEMSFEAQFVSFWTAMNENYCIWDYEELFGLDWDEVLRVYRPQFAALDDTLRQTPVTDDELRALYASFLDSLHDGHSVFQIKNIKSGQYIVVYPNQDRNMRERPQRYQDEEQNVTTLDVYRTAAANVSPNHRIKVYDATGSQDIIIELLDSAFNRILRGTAAYVAAVDDAGGPNVLNDSLYSAVLEVQKKTQTTYSLFKSLPRNQLEGALSTLVSQFNSFSKEYSIVFRQIGVAVEPIDTQLASDHLKSLRFALFEDNIAYLRIGGFYMTDHLVPGNISTDTTSTYYAYQMAVNRVWHHWFDTIQVLHAQGKLGGIIIDVRNNGGGYTDDYQYVLGALLPSGGWESHTLRLKNGTGRLDFAPLIPFVMSTYPKEHAVITEEPIVVLANSKSISMSENTTWGVRSQPNGHFIGTRTFGGLSALSADPKYYSTNYSGSFGVESVTPFYGYVPSFVCLYGEELLPVEGHGFDPDEDVPLDVQMWKTEGRDNQLERALDYIQGK